MSQETEETKEKLFFLFYFDAVKIKIASNKYYYKILYSFLNFFFVKSLTISVCLRDGERDSSNT